MKREVKPRKAFDRFRVFEEAVRYAYLKQATFTAPSLAEICHCADTRHFRGYLMELVDRGWLIRSRVLFTDGHYRYVFCGQLARELPFLYVPSRLMDAVRYEELSK